MDIYCTNHFTHCVCMCFGAKGRVMDTRRIIIYPLVSNLISKFCCVIQLETCFRSSGNKQI